MQKHHAFIVVGLFLAVIAPLIPLIARWHGAGVGLMIAGGIDWYWARRSM